MHGGTTNSNNRSTMLSNAISYRTLPPALQWGRGLKLSVCTLCRHKIANITANQCILGDVYLRSNLSRKHHWKHTGNVTPCTAVQLTERITMHFIHLKCAVIQHEKLCKLIPALNSFRKQSIVVVSLPFVPCSRSHAKVRKIEQWLIQLR